MLRKENRLLKDLPPAPKGKTGWPWDTETDPEVYNNLNSFPKISIVTPSFNQGEYLEQTIRSVLLQNYPDTEYVIIDGGSSDNSIEIIKKYSHWLKYWESSKDEGQSHAINKGIKQCSGEVFNWLNSDDYYHPGCFATVAGMFSSEEALVAAGAYRYFDESMNRRDKIIRLRLKPTQEETIAFTLMDQPSTFFRRKIITEFGGVDEHLKFVMDQDLWKKFLFKYGIDGIRISDSILANFRLHEKSKTYQNLFSEEYHGIFYSIALRIGLKRQAELIAGEFNPDKGTDYEFKYDFSGKDNLTALKAINYLIYFIGRKHFSKGNFKSSSDFISAVSYVHLNEKHRHDFKKLRLKLMMIKFKLDFLFKKPESIVQTEV